MPLRRPSELTLDALYLHARSPAEARIVFFAAEGPSIVGSLLGPELAAVGAPIVCDLLLPTEESALRALTSVDARESDLSAQRIAPALWRIDGLGVPLRQAVPWLAGLALDRIGERDVEPTLRLLILASRLAMKLLTLGDFAFTDVRGVPRAVPFWTPHAVEALGALAQIVPESLLTGRRTAHDQPVYAVTPRNFVVSFVTHAVGACAEDHSSRRERAEPLPRDFWRTRPAPILEVQKPAQELEEGVPWGIQVLFRPTPGFGHGSSLAELEEGRSNSVFPDVLWAEALTETEARMDDLAEKIPALRRAISMSDGRASLNRQELDAVLDHLPLLESSGFEIRLPGVERMLRLSAHVRLTEDKASSETLRPWFDFDWSLAVDDRALTKDEFDKLVNSRSPVVFLERGAVLLAPRDRDAIEAFRKRRASKESTRIGFFEALRLKLGGATHLHGLPFESLQAGPRLDEIATNLDRARSIEPRPMAPGFVGELRPYQSRGHAWLFYLVDQGFGACLADDMGLGKTVQAISVILDWRQNPKRRGTILLVCPVSVLGNWRRELHRFAPELRVTMHHGKTRASNDAEFDEVMRGADVILTSFNLLQRDEEILSTKTFEGIVLDEAQNIKNPTTRQSKAARKLRGSFRLALTGTPLENRPLDLWSIMDFLNEGLLGTKTSFLQTLEHPIVRQQSRSTASTLARLVRPFVLRRLKTDPDIITDLPEKTEQVVATSLSREQAILYEAVVRKGLDEVEKAGEGIQRRGAVLTTLLRLKQVCNHPAHYLMDGSSLTGRSGKLDLLVEMLEEAIDEGDRCLVFTQFKEMGTLLKTHLEAVLKGPVLFLHGGVPQKDREDMVASFQAQTETTARVFVLSLKAGGTGLNLTAANRVFHFDRWWNPAVEDQATDRAFRIGQNRNVFVHKFVCTGTLEERIQTMLERKREVAGSLLGAGETWLTELSNEELRRLLVLDRREALA